MFNVGPAEFVIIGLVLLIAVGPEQLPSVVRKVGQTVGQLRSMTDGLRSEFMAGVEELERSADPKQWASSSQVSSPPDAPGRTIAESDDIPADDAPTGADDAPAGADDDVAGSDDDLAASIEPTSGDDAPTGGQTAPAGRVIESWNRAALNGTGAAGSDPAGSNPVEASTPAERGLDDDSQDGAA